MELGDRIRIRRIQLGMTLEDVGTKLGVARATVLRYESGEIENVKLSTVEKLADILKTTPAYLMGWEDRETKKATDDAVQAKVEHKLMLVARRVQGIPEDQRERLIKNFEETIDIYLEGINKGEK